MRILTDNSNSSNYITYREGTKKINGVEQTVLYLTVHDKNISKDRKTNASAKAFISFQELLDYTIKNNTL